MFDPHCADAIKNVSDIEYYMQLITRVMMCVHGNPLSLLNVQCVPAINIHSPLNRAAEIWVRVGGDFWVGAFRGSHKLSEFRRNSDGIH